ncbi:MAG: hypothetical protein Q7U57_02310 [Methylovulum sp.]|nr:hypothetical protein [Methylovulum sp.]
MSNTERTRQAQNLKKEFEKISKSLLDFNLSVEQFKSQFGHDDPFAIQLGIITEKIPEMLKDDTRCYI